MKRTLASLAAVASVGLFAGALTLITPSAEAATFDTLTQSAPEVVTQKVAHGFGVWESDDVDFVDEFNYIVKEVTYMGVPANFIVDEFGITGYLVLNSDGTATYFAIDADTIGPIITDGYWSKDWFGKVTFTSPDGVTATFSNVVAFN